MLVGSLVNAQDQVWDLSGPAPKLARRQPPPGATRYFWSDGLKRWITIWPSEVTLWEPADGQPIKRASVPLGAVGNTENAVSSPSGKQLVVATNTGSLQWFGISPTAVTAGEISETSSNHQPTAMCWTPLEDRFAVGIAEGQIEFWDTTGDHLQRHSLLECPGTPVSLDFSADGRRLTAGNSTGVVRVWRLDREPVAEPIELQAGRVIVKAAISPDGGTLATIGEDALVRLWDLRRIRPRNCSRPPGIGAGSTQSPSRPTASSWLRPVTIGRSGCGMSVAWSRGRARSFKSRTCHF